MSVRPVAVNHALFDLEPEAAAFGIAVIEACGLQGGNISALPDIKASVSAVFYSDIYCIYRGIIGNAVIYIINGLCRYDLIYSIYIILSGISDRIINGIKLYLSIAVIGLCLNDIPASSALCPVSVFFVSRIRLPDAV